MVETNFADGNELDLSYFDMNFFEGPSDNFNCLVDDENNVIKNEERKRETERTKREL